MLKLKLENANHSGANAIIIEDVVRNIRQDEQLTTNLESSSLLWKVTLPHDCAYSTTILEEDEWSAVLYDEDSSHNTYPFFTGYLSDSANYTINQNGQQALQVTLEDKGVHLFKQPYTKTVSEEISGDFSYDDDQTQRYGVIQQLCKKLNIDYNISYTDTTPVRYVVEPSETYESLLKSLCKEFCYAYSFDNLGRLYLIPLSTSNFVNVPEVNDTELYDSIQLSKKAATYKGSRIEYKELATRTGALIYRDISKPNDNATHPDCWISLNAGDVYPAGNNSITYYKVTDLQEGAEVFSFDSSTLSTTVNWYDGSGTTDVFTNYGVNELQIKITCVTNGHIDKLEASADLTYVKSKNVVYGNADSITEALREEECKWIHTEDPAKKYANFIAQYDKYCSRTFTFKTTNNYTLGQIIRLRENLHTGLGSYIMITRRTRTLTDYDSTNKSFSGVWTYDAVSTSEFDYSKQVIPLKTTVPPSTTYTEMPDLSDVSGFTLSTDKSNLVRDSRSTATQTITISANITGVVDPITITAEYSTGQSIISTAVSVPYTMTLPEAMPYSLTTESYPSSVNVHATAGTLTYNMAIPVVDKTMYYKCLGNFQDDVTCISYCSQNNIPILIGDFYVINNSNSAAKGDTRECYSYNNLSGEPNFQNMPLDINNASKFLASLYEATKSGVDLTRISSPNTVSWFNTIIAAKAIIDNLFSQYITILDTGSIHSSAYSDVGAKVNANPGFWLGANGQLLCDSGQMTNLSISGNSVFGGDFDCDVIKTADGSVSVRGTAQATDISKYQSRQLARDIRSLSLGGGLQPARIQNASGTYQQAVAYVSFLIDEGSHNTEYRVSFFDSSGSSINVTNMFSCTTNRESGPSIHYRKGDGISPPEYYTYSNVSFTIEFTQGANRTLQLTLPGGSSGLASGMIYRDSSGYVRIV